MSTLAGAREELETHPQPLCSQWMRPWSWKTLSTLLCQIINPRRAGEFLVFFLQSRQSLEHTQHVRSADSVFECSMQVTEASSGTRDLSPSSVPLVGGGEILGFPSCFLCYAHTLPPTLLTDLRGYEGGEGIFTKAARLLLGKLPGLSQRLMEF